jgi:hypothetical protein
MALSMMVDVSESEVGKVVQDYIDFDAKTNIKCSKSSDGKWKIVAEDE